LKSECQGYGETIYGRKSVSYKHVWEFYQIYNFGAVEDKDILNRFSGQKVKSYSETFPTEVFRSMVCRQILSSF